MAMRGRVLDRRRPPLDVIDTLAHEVGEVVLYVGGTFETVPAPPPGDALPSWPEVSP